MTPAEYALKVRDAALANECRRLAALELRAAILRGEEPHEFDALGPTRPARRRAVKAHFMTLPRADRRRIRRARCTVTRRSQAWRAAEPGRASAVAWDRLESAIRYLIDAQDAVALSGPIAPSGVMAAWRLTP